jgi:hypothetical protein
MHFGTSGFTSPSRDRLGAMVRDAGFEPATSCALSKMALFVDWLKYLLCRGAIPLISTDLGILYRFLKIF